MIDNRIYGIGGPRQIAIDAVYVYWVNHDDVDFREAMLMRRPKTGESRGEALTSSQHAPEAIVVDDNNVYWMNRGKAPDTGRLMRVTKPRGDTRTDPVELATGLHGPTELAADHDYLYWGNGTSVLRIKKDAHPDDQKPDDQKLVPEVVATLEEEVAFGIAVDEDYVYFGTFGPKSSVYSAPKDHYTHHAPPEVLGPSNGSLASSNGSRDLFFAVDETYLYWSQDNVLMRVRKDRRGGPCRLFTAEADFTGDADPRPPAIGPLAIASERIYFALNGIHSIHRDGCESGRVGGCQSTHTNGCESRLTKAGGELGVVVDDSAVYFTQGRVGTVSTVPR